MIIRQRNLHHGSGHDGTIFNHRTQVSRVHAQNRTLRRVHNRRREHAAEYTSVGHCERTSRHVLRGYFAISGHDSLVIDIFFDVSHCFLLHIPDHWNHQTFGATHCHTNVMVVAVYYFVIVNYRIDDRLAVQCLRTGFQKESHKPNFDSVFFCKYVLVFFAHVDDISHVNFVECCQKCVSVL